MKYQKKLGKLQRRVGRASKNLFRYKMELADLGYEVDKIEDLMVEMLILDTKIESESDFGFRVCVKGKLSYKEQQQIAGLNEQELFEYLFRSATVYAKGIICPEKGGWRLNVGARGLCILPENENPATSALESLIIESLTKAIPLSKYEKFGKDDRSPYLYQITNWEGKLYVKQDEFVDLARLEEEDPIARLEKELDPNVQRERDFGSLIVEKQLRQINGQKFFAAAFVEPGFFLKYHPNEIVNIAPKSANAYQLGDSIFRILVDNDGSFKSPIVAAKALKGAIPERCSYHVMPVKFYKITL